MKKIENIQYSDNSECMLDLYLPDSENFPVFVYFHGGGLEAGDKEWAKVYAEYLANHGVATVSANYRMYPNAKYPDFIIDAVEAVAWTKRHIEEYGSPDGIYVGGSSAGGYLSMMLCFDTSYYEKVSVNPNEISGYIHNAGQPTCHFNVLRENNKDTRRVIVDETAPLYYVGLEKLYPKMLFIVSDNDMENRYEQTMLIMSTLKHFGINNTELKLMHGEHCEHDEKIDENGESVFGKIIYEFIKRD